MPVEWITCPLPLIKTRYSRSRSVRDGRSGETEGSWSLKPHPATKPMTEPTKSLRVSTLPPYTECQGWRSYGQHTSRYRRHRGATVLPCATDSCPNRVRPSGRSLAGQARLSSSGKESEQPCSETLELANSY